MQQQVSFERRPSRAPLYDTAPLPWPVCDYRLYPQTGPLPQAHGQDGLLIGEGNCPSFPGYQTALRAFFTGNFSTMGGGQVSSDLGRIRVAQTDAWFRRIRISATALEIWVAGQERQGARVEINGSTWRANKTVGKTGKVRLPLPRGLPDDAWLYLSRAGHWLDYRALGSRIAGGADLASAGVEIEIPDDQQTEVEALLSVGEGPYIEYKRQLPETTIESKRKVLKTIAAFANGEGGRVVFGMDPDEVTVVGLAGASAQTLRDRLGNLIRGNVVPPDPDYHLRSATIEGKLVLALEVLPSPNRPYGLRFQDKPVEFYVRRGASTYAARQEEIRAMAQPVAPATTTRGFPFL